jgi:hypothetical protein
MSAKEPRMKAKPSAGSRRPRNPFAIVVRRRKAGPERDPRAYRRRPKHGCRRTIVEAEERGGSEKP